MVAFEEVADEIPPSQERFLDAEEISKAASTMKRPTARMHLEALAKKLRREGEALKRVEKSKVAAETANKKVASSDSGEAKSGTPPSSAHESTPSYTPAPTVPKGVKYVPVDRFSFDAGGYNAPFVTVYVPLPGVGGIDRSSVTCNFTKSSFDLVVEDLQGKSYRLFKDCLEKDIDPDKSKIVVKADKILVKLAKVKQGEYGGYDYWSKLTDNKKSRTAGSKAKDDPQASIMELMKNMYEEGDDNMKKVIGETMMKQRTGELGGNMGMDDIGGL